MEIIKLIIQSKNLDKQEHFYQSVLGFKCERVSEKLLHIHANKNVLALEHSTNNFYYHFAFLIPTGSINKAIELLENKNIPLLTYNGSKIINFSDGKAIYFYDEDGNIAEFIERPDLDYPAKEHFSIDDVIKLNEIGLPVHNPKEMADKLVSNHGVAPLNQAGFSDNFCWVGDNNGVIIVVKEGRNWLPTNDKPGIVNDFRLLYSEGGKEYKVSFENNEITSWDY